MLLYGKEIKDLWQSKYNHELEKALKNETCDIKEYELIKELKDEVPNFANMNVDNFIDFIWDYASSSILTNPEIFQNTNIVNMNIKLISSYMKVSTELSLCEEFSGMHNFPSLKIKNLCTEVCAYLILIPIASDLLQEYYSKISKEEENDR